MQTKNQSFCQTPMTVQSLARLPYYLQHLKKLDENGVAYISAIEAAQSLGLHEVSVRKDFAAVSRSKGKPKVGFCVRNLIYDIEDSLGYHTLTDAVLVGVGSLGKALFCYDGFMPCGLRIVAGFDTDARLAGSTLYAKPVYAAHELSQKCREMGVKIGIVAVPSVCAQAVCDKLIEGGILAIWNFAPVKLSVPKNILVHNENIVTSLTVLARQLHQKLAEQEQ